jgi:hypothetical protein
VWKRDLPPVKTAYIRTPFNSALLERFRVLLEKHQLLDEALHTRIRALQRLCEDPLVTPELEAAELMEYEKEGFELRLRLQRVIEERLQRIQDKPLLGDIHFLLNLAYSWITVELPHGSDRIVVDNPIEPPPPLAPSAGAGPRRRGPGRPPKPELEEAVRFQANLDPPTFKLFNEVKDRLQAPTHADALRQTLRYVKWHFDRKSEGYRIVAQRDDGTREVDLI